MRGFGGGIRRGAQTPQGVAVSLSMLFIIFFSIPAYSALGPEDVLLLVNAESNTSRYIAKMYRSYYPDIQNWQVLELTGLPDCSGPSSTTTEEILTRDQYNTLIADPVRSYLLAGGYETTLKVIITTAGMPYRIEDTNPAFANVIYPGGSDWTIVQDNEDQVDAASVESELTCLWYAGYGSTPFELENRMVNPYQGYRSEFDLFQRLLPEAAGLRWVYGYSRESGVASPKMEGNRYGYGATDRLFGPGHIYLVCRLDGPKNQGKSAVFVVREILERSSRASNPAFGVNPKQASVVIDDAPSAPAGDIDYNRVYNLHKNVSFWNYEEHTSHPPDAYKIRIGDDYVGAFEQLTEDIFMYENNLDVGTFQFGQDIPVLLDYRPNTAVIQSDLNILFDLFSDRTAQQGVVGFCCFGTNGDEGRNKDYLLSGGPDGGPLFRLVDGAVFTSLESFNAVTLFSDAVTTQNKIINFIAIGGSGAVGHAFEPQADAAIDNEFLFYNLLADRDQDNKADLTFVEAAYTAIPYVSWSEVVIGDPLMRITYGTGENEAWTPFTGDVNKDGRVNGWDVYLTKYYLNGSLRDGASPEIKDKYNDLCDINNDLIVNSWDLYLVKMNYGNMQ